MYQKLRFTNIPVIKTHKNLVSEKNISFISKSASNAIKYIVYIDKHRITFDEAMDLFYNSKNFRNKFITKLRNVKFQGYFLEMAPSDKLFEFTLINVPVFSNIKANSTPFKDKLKNCLSDTDVISFMNFSMKSKLIVPCSKTKNKEVYTHIANFIRYAPINQIHSLLKEIPVQVNSFRKRNDPIWVSTHGLGVYWLHVRLDSLPKYYKTQKYK